METERQRDRERQREMETDRQRDRERQREMETDRNRNRKRCMVQIGCSSGPSTTTNALSLSLKRERHANRTQSLRVPKQRKLSCFRQYTSGIFLRDVCVGCPDRSNSAQC